LQRKSRTLRAVDGHGLVKLDLGADAVRPDLEGHVRVDFFGGKVDLTKRWPWKSNSVAEGVSNYLLQYLTPGQRIHFANELYRVLVPGGKFQIHTPHEFAARAYADLRVQWPPVTEWWYPALNAEFRKLNKVEQGYTCNFDNGIGYGLHPALHARNPEFQQEAMAWKKEACQDLIVTLTAIKD
jgi:hypothetical protein